MIENNELLRVLCYGVKGGSKFPIAVRQFCLSMQFYSTRAYNFLRNTFGNTLPHIQTIQSWYAQSDVAGDAGIQEANMAKLKKIAKQHEERTKSKIICTLIADEMSIRQHIFWSPPRNSYEGFVDRGSSDKIAKQALVYMLNGVNCCFEFPVCYWMIDSMDSKQRKQNVLQVLQSVTSAGVIVKFLVFDGCPSNVSMSKMLVGENFDPFSPRFQTFFKNPDNNENVYIYLDPCHMIKLLRNTFSNRTISDQNGNKIEWRYIEHLYEFSAKNTFNVHKLTKKHMNWRKNPMNVALAVQVLSASIANAIELLMNANHPDFSEAEATIYFLRQCNTLFDIFNTRDIQHNSIYKRALNPENKRVVVDFLENIIDYFKLLNVATDTQKVTPILNSRNRTGFLGIIISIRSLIHFYTEYVEEDSKISMIPTYSLQQDPLEKFFGRLRARNGFNNNPNIQQFKGAFRRLLCNIEIDAPDTGNCRIFERSLPEDYLFSNVFTVSSKRTNLTFGDIEDAYKEQEEDILKTVFQIDQIEMHDPLLDTATNYRVAHVAKEIENKIRKRLECRDCMGVFETESKAIGVGSITMPCKSTFKICEHADKFTRLHDINKKDDPKYDFRVIYCLMFRTLNLDQLYKNFEFKCGTNHKYALIRSIILQYIAIMSKYSSQQITLDQYQNMCRQHYNKLTIFRGQ